MTQQCWKEKKTRNSVLIFLLLFGTTVAWSQTERGGIRGTISDPTGAVVPNANVTATNVANGASASTVSTGAGVYNLPALPPGTYRVEVNQPGFKGLVRENVIVDAASVLGLDLALQIGAANQVVTVNSSGPILQTESSSTNTAVSAQAYVDLPLSSAGGGRYSGGFLQLVPGWASTGVAPNNNRMQDSINGGQLNTKDIQIDGATTNTVEITGDGRNTIWPPDVVQELSVATSGYAAEYGNTGGGVERYVLKSGTNDLHGDAYEFFRNNVLDARGFFGKTTPIHRENEFGFTAGGPITIPKVYNGRNTSFFFFGVNWYRYSNSGSPSTTSLPNDAFRVGNLSGLPQTIYDPGTTQQLANGSFTRAPFAGNIIPVDRISPVSQNILSYIPHSNTQSIYNNYFAPVNSNYNNQTTYSIKGDHYFSPKHRLSISNVYARNPFYSSGVLPNPIETGYGPIRVYTFDFGRLTYDWTITPSILNQFRIGFNRQTQFATSAEGRDGGWPGKLGMQGLNLASGDFPTITLGSFNSLAGHNYSYPVSNTGVLSDALSWTKGRHNFKFGGEGRENEHSFQYQNPVSMSFSRNETASPAALSSTGLEFASFLLGQVDSSSVAMCCSAVPHNVWKQYGLYAQDDYKVTSKLTINYGVRWDLFTPLTESHNIYSVMDPTAPNPFAGNLPGAYVFAGQNGQGNRLTYAKNDSSNFAPRLGVAWKATDRFVIRAGYGISYFVTGAYGAGNNTQVLQGYWFTSTTQSLNSGITPGYQWDQAWPQNLLVIPPYLSAGLGVGSGSIQYWDSSAGRAAYSQNWNFTTQTQLASDLSLEVGYVASKGTHLPTANTDPNQLNPAYYGLGSLLSSNINSSAAAAAGFTSPYPGFTGSLAQALRPFPQYVTTLAGSRALSSATLGNSTYHSLQAKLEKRFSKGFFALVAYSWSKGLTDADSNSVGNGAVLGRNNYDRGLDKIVTPFNRPQRLVGSFTYELPIGPGKTFLTRGGAMGKLLGGWQVNGILTYMSGTPITVTAPQTLLLNNGPQTPNSVLGVSQMGSWSNNFDPATDRYLNINAFSLPTPYHFGTSALYLPNVRSPSYYNEDLALVKNTKIGERFNLQIRLEAFNALNRVVFAAPATDTSVSQTFGVITKQANSARNGQLAAKLTF
jgi:hypothetical protein